jgi:hypothetical protein
MTISRAHTICPRAFTDRVQFRRVENDLYKGWLSSLLNSTDSCSVTEKCKQQFYTTQMNLPLQRLSDSESISLDQSDSLLSPHSLFIILVAQGLSP